MAARQCKVCRYGGGICQPGFKKVHVRDDPQCRLHGVTGRMNQRLTVPYQPPSPTPSGGMAQRAETPLDQKTAFRTQGGMHLLFEPEASDEWMKRSIETCEGGGYVDTASGEPLNSIDEAAYEVYLQRLCERHRIGEQADRLARIVDQYLPDIAGENRAYIMRFPHKVSVMLPKARALRRRIRRKLKMRQGENGGQGEDQAAASSKPRAPEQAEPPPVIRGSTEVHATKAANVEEDTPPDWGDEERSGSEEASSSRGHSEEPKTCCPDLGGEERERGEADSSRGRAEEPSTQSMAVGDNGETFRPRVRTAETQRARRGTATQASTSHRQAQRAVGGTTAECAKVVQHSKGGDCNHKGESHPGAKLALASTKSTGTHGTAESRLH